MINHKIEAQAIKNAIHAANSVLLVAHKKPDGDTVGSVCGWLNFLSPRGKDVHAFCLDPVPNYLRHIPGSQKIATDPEIFERPFDVIIINDSGDLEYSGAADFINARDNARTTIINVDHHTTNPNYGDLNLVVSGASATAEIIARLYLHWSEDISKPVAESLLNGITTDTDSFTNPATSYLSLIIASELVRAGADLHTIVQKTLYTKSIADLKLWGLVLSRLKRNEKYKIVSSYITAEDAERFNVTGPAVDGIANYLTLIPDVNLVVFLKQIDANTIKGSLRSIKNSVDVSALAQVLGGGGHKKASGFRMHGRLVTAGDNWTIQ